MDRRHTFTVAGLLLLITLLSARPTDGRTVSDSPVMPLLGALSSPKTTAFHACLFPRLNEFVGSVRHLKSIYETYPKRRFTGPEKQIMKYIKNIHKRSPDSSDSGIESSISGKKCTKAEWRLEMGKNDFKNDKTLQAFMDTLDTLLPLAYYMAYHIAQEIRPLVPAVFLDRTYSNRPLAEAVAKDYEDRMEAYKKALIFIKDGKKFEAANSLATSLKITHNKLVPPFDNYCDTRRMYHFLTAEPYVEVDIEKRFIGLLLYYLNGVEDYPFIYSNSPLDS
eukprot:Filipodium_phascolosomae@DN2600_c0_g1_i3.p1